MYMKGRNVFYRLTMNEPDAADELSDRICRAHCGQLDVVVLTQVLFTKFLRFDHARLDNEKLIGYASTAREAVHGLLAGNSMSVFC